MMLHQIEFITFSGHRDQIVVGSGRGSYFIAKMLEESTDVLAWFMEQETYKSIHRYLEKTPFSSSVKMFIQKDSYNFFQNEVTRYLMQAETVLFDVSESDKISSLIRYRNHNLDKPPEEQVGMVEA